MLDPCSTVVKNLPANAGDMKDMGPIPRSGRSPGGENDNSLQYSCLQNPMDRGVGQIIVQGVAKELDMTVHAHRLELNPNKICLLQCYL